jgi:hypothetical protein
MYYKNICNKTVKYVVTCLGVPLDGSVAAQGTFDTPPILCRVVAKP